MQLSARRVSEDRAASATSNNQYVLTSPPVSRRTSRDASRNVRYMFSLTRSGINNEYSEHTARCISRTPTTARLVLATRGRAMCDLLRVYLPHHHRRRRRRCRH